jgi:protein FAM50
LKKSTIGLVTLDEFRKTRNDIEEAQRREAAQKQLTDDEAGKAKRKKKEKKKERVALSFDIDEDEEETAFSKKRSNGDGSGKWPVGSTEFPSCILIHLFSPPNTAESSTKKARLTKNPTIDTSFLPDRDREARERLEREHLRKEWLEKQEKTKAEAIEVTYSYWDGTGHRKMVEVGFKG